MTQKQFLIGLIGGIIGLGTLIILSMEAYARFYVVPYDTTQFGWADCKIHEINQKKQLKANFKHND